MKINEFIEKVNGHDGMRAIKNDDGIAVGALHNNGIFIIPEDAFIIPEDATNFLEIEAWATSNRLYWKKADREYLSALIEELLHTPVKERFPEKKYRLRWFDDDDGTPNYLNCLMDDWNWDWLPTKKDAKIYTEKELQQLKVDNPRLASAIDAMKEPVEDDN